MNLYEKSAYELSGMLKNKQTSSVEITKSVFDRIESGEEKVDSYVTLIKENALKKAEEVDQKLSNGYVLSPLAGIPI